MASLGASWPGERPLTGSLDFSVTVLDPANATVAAIDLGGDVVAYAATYAHGSRHESQEILAYADDVVLFDAIGPQLVATRFNPHGLKDVPAQAIARRP